MQNIIYSLFACVKILSQLQLSKDGALKFDVTEIRLAVEVQLLITEASLHGRDRIESQAAHTFRFFRVKPLSGWTRNFKRAAITAPLITIKSAYYWFIQTQLS